MKKILGLDLGTNSIGWAVLETDFDKKEGRILDLGSRILPMSQDQLDKFGKGQSISQTAERTKYRSVRRLYERAKLRRERLHRVLNILGFLPEHYKEKIDFDKNPGQFKEEVKLNYRRTETGKYEFIFMDSFNEMIKDFSNKKVSYDWTLYYLRKKALSYKISKEELAWIILNFNQKRGYYQLRGEEEDNQDDKIKTYEVLTVDKVIKTEERTKGKNEALYDIYFTNGWKYDKPTTKPENWIGKTKEFIVTTSTTKEGKVKRTYKSVNSEKDWIAIKQKTEQDLDNYISQDDNRTVGTYIYDRLLQDPNIKIKGKLIRTIERKYYKEELNKILTKQIELQPELFTSDLYEKCIFDLYPHNDIHRNNIKQKDFKYLFIDDIIFYQRPLKSKKSTIAGCQYETRSYYKTVLDEQTGEEKRIKVQTPLQVIHKSHPLYQEFRLWQFLKNLRIYQKEVQIDDKLKINYDITDKLLKNEEDWVALFDFLNDKKDVTQKQIIDFFVKQNLIDKKEKDNYRWNYVEDKKYPANETRATFLSRLKKVKGFDIQNFNYEFIKNLWHIIYSIKDNQQFEKALKTFALKHNLDEETFVENFKKYPSFKNDYGAYSEKALKKILPLMRRGKYWNKQAISQEVINRIESIMERVNAMQLPENPTKEQVEKALDKVADDDIPKQIIKSFIPFRSKNPLSGLNTYQACYAIYNRHSETKDITQWKTPEDIDKYLDKFKQHSLRNPIVEQVIMETLRTVRDIWKKYGKFDEIHLELGRELKNPAEKRKQITQRITENQNTNERIRLLLNEMVEYGAKPYSPKHQEILKIYEEGIWQNPDTKFEKLSKEDIIKIRKNQSPTTTKKLSPTRQDIQKYKLWLEQGYISPYTGKSIPLSKLFSTEYEIEHIIPQSRYFDNSMNNKVICESDVNIDKSNKTAYEYIKEKGGSSINGHKLFTLEEYEQHVKRYFSRNRTKLKNLLSEDIPDSFIERQINDTRYISKFIKGLLSNIVREDGEQEATSKNLISVVGSITDRLKQDWGLNDVWNEIILPRFEKLNQLTGTNDFTTYNTQGKIIPDVPDELKKGFSKKRIDHRHHAMDALVIAACTRKHIQYINSLNNQKIKYDLRPSLMVKNKNGNYIFIKPWKNFTVDAKKALETTVVTFKQNLRIINRTNNKYWKYVNGKKQLVKQEGKNFAIRKPLHKETFSGLVFIKDKKEVSFNKKLLEALKKENLEEKYILVNKQLHKKIRELERKHFSHSQIISYFKREKYLFEEKSIKKVEVFFLKKATATRKELSQITSEKQINNITDEGIRLILKKHIENYKNEKGKYNFSEAFSPEGIEALNKNITYLNKGKPHKPIYHVRLYEVGDKFPISQKKEFNKHKKYVEAAQGTNLYFAIYKNVNGKRQYETVPLYQAIAHQKEQVQKGIPYQKQTPIPINSNLGEFLFTLSPGDLVYVPTDEEIKNPSSVNFENLSKEQVDRMYVVNDFNDTTIYFTPIHLSKNIAPKEVDLSINKKNKKLKGSFDTKTANFKDKQIKKICWKLKTDRLGNIIEVIR